MGKTRRTANQDYFKLAGSAVEPEVAEAERRRVTEDRARGAPPVAAGPQPGRRAAPRRKGER